MVLPAGYCGSSTNRIHYLAGYGYGRTLVNVGKSVVNVLSLVEPAHKNSKDYGVLDNCQRCCDRCSRVHYSD